MTERGKFADAEAEIVNAALLRGQVEIGIVSGRPELNGILCRPLFGDAFGLVTAKVHPLMRKAARPLLLDLKNHAFVSNSLCTQIAWPAFQELLAATKDAARNTLSSISMVRDGSRMTVLPASVVSIIPKHLAFLEIAGLDQKRAVSLLTRKNCLCPELTEECARFLSDQVAAA